MSEWKVGADKAPDSHSGVAFFPSGLQLSRSKRAKQKNNGIE